MKLEKRKIQIIKMHDQTTNDDEYVKGSIAFRFGSVWELTIDVMSFQRGFDAKSRLQRNVVHLIRQSS